LVQKCSIQSPESGNSCFNWLGLGIESTVAFDSLPEHVSFLAGPLDSAPTTVTSANVTSNATAVTDHHHRQSFLSPSRPSQQNTVTMNPGDTSHRCGTDHFHSQQLL
jgi:hypothetical protein